MNKKNMPLVLMLVAGVITCIITFIQQYSPLKKLVSLFIVLVLFYLLGSALKWTLDFFEQQNEKRRKEEGEVVEKEAEGQTDTQEDKEESQESDID